MIVFVGDKPSRLNTDPKVPFIGTPSWKNLSKWIDSMLNSSHRFTVMNSQTHGNMQLINAHKKLNATFIALGNEASKRLKKAGVDHFKLPHPSPRNRLLNDKSYIVSQLKKCYDYIEERENV